MRLDLEQIRRGFAGKLDDSTRRAPPGRHAAVAAILRQASSGGQVLLIERAEDERDPWSGHMALPGGHCHADDADLVATAQRETWEEVGLSLARDARLLGRLDSARTATTDRGFEICPLVFELERDAELSLNPREVKTVVWANLGFLRSPEAATSFEHRAPGTPSLRFPAFDVEGHVVWGLTYRILNNLLDVAR